MAPRNDHRASGRLAPPRPDFAWGTPSTSQAQTQARSQVRSPAPRYNYQEQQLESGFRPYEEGDPYDEPIYLDAPSQDDRRRSTGTFEVDYDDTDAPVEHEVTYADSYDEEPSHPDPIDAEPVSPREPVHQQPESYAATYPIQYAAQNPAPGALSMQERQQLLMHTIQLYDDKWKLAGIRANQRKNWLQGYLTPRNKHIDLKEAISKNRVLIITIDSRGNTDINEPKKPGPWRRLTWWIFGG